MILNPTLKVFFSRGVIVGVPGFLHGLDRTRESWPFVWNENTTEIICLYFTSIRKSFLCVPQRKYFQQIDIRLDEI